MPGPLFEFSIQAAGEVTDKDGNPVVRTTDEKENDQ